MKLKYLSILLFPLSLPISSAQTLIVWPTVVTATKGSWPSLDAIVVGTNNKTVTWTTTGGTLVGTNPCIANEPCAIALYSLTPGTYTVTATSNANSSVTATTTVTITNSPTPISGTGSTGHPRLGITPSMVAALQAKAIGGNVMFAALESSSPGPGAVYIYNHLTLAPISWSWTANGGTGLPAPGTDATDLIGNAWLFAFLSIVDASNVDYNWGSYAADILRYYENQVLTGGHSINGNEWSDMSPYDGVADLLMWGGFLNSSDKTLARSYLYYMGKYVITNGYGANAPIGGYNSLAQLVTSPSLYELGVQRTMGNNYTESKILILTDVALTFDNTSGDDPPQTNTCSATPGIVCPDGTAYNLHAYFTYLTGGMLWKEYAHLEDPGIVQPAYNTFFAGSVPTQPTCEGTDGAQHPCFGDGRGGESSEGRWYGYAMTRIRMAMNNIHTAGFNDATIYGPQVSLDVTSFWDMEYMAHLEFWTGQAPLYGSSYNYLTTGDSDDAYRSINDMWTEAAMLVSDIYTGRTDRANALEWAVLNASLGGPDGIQASCSSHCGFVDNINNDYGNNPVPWLYIALPAGNPVTSPPTDPRSAFPTDLYNGSFNQHQMVRDGWSNYTLFSFYGSGSSQINHESVTAGGFDLWSKGEHITKRRIVFADYNYAMSASPAANQVSIESSGTSCTIPSCTWWEGAQYGGQFWQSQQAGLVTLYHSELPTYAADIIDTTNDYNMNVNLGYTDYTDVSLSRRSLVYLRSLNKLVYYDRATTGASGYKRLYQGTTGAITVSGNQAHWLTPSTTQKAYFTKLLPTGATLTGTPITLSVSLSGNHSTIQNGTTQQMDCISNNADSTTTNENSNAYWVSGDTSIFTVSSSGLITAVGLGTTSINCSYLGMGPGGNITVSSSSSGSFPTSTYSEQNGDWEPYGQLEVDAGTPTSTQFLSVDEWGSSSFSSVNPTLVQSTSGQNFDGAVIGTSVVMFMKTPATFTNTTYAASGGTTQYISDLAPNTTYGISGVGTPSTAKTDTAGVLVFSATGTGNITIGTPSMSGGAFTKGIFKGVVQLIMTWPIL